MSEHHLPSRRRLLLGTAALPLLATTGCALVPFEALPPLARSPLPGPGPATRMRAPAVGQRWTYAQFNQFNSALLDTVTESVASVGGSTGESTVVARRSASGRELPYRPCQVGPRLALPSRLWQARQPLFCAS